MDDITPSTTTLVWGLRLNSGEGHQVALADHLAYASLRHDGGEASSLTFT